MRDEFGMLPDEEFDLRFASKDELEEEDDEDFDIVDEPKPKRKGPNAGVTKEQKPRLTNRLPRERGGIIAAVGDGMTPFERACKMLGDRVRCTKTYYTLDGRPCNATDLMEEADRLIRADRAMQIEAKAAKDAALLAEQIAAKLAKTTEKAQRAADAKAAKAAERAAQAAAARAEQDAEAAQEPEATVE